MAWKKQDDKKWRGAGAAKKNKAKPAEVEQKIIGTKEQDAIWKEMVEGDSHLVVEAFAGTGKTFTMVEGIKRLMKEDNGNIAFVAFNKSIATELQEKVPDEVTACTMHSHGFAAIRNAFGKVKVNSYKTVNFLEKHYGGRDNLTPQDIIKINAAEKLIGLCKNTLTGFYTEGAYMVDAKDLETLCDQYDVECNDSKKEIFDLVPQILMLSAEQTHEIDFDDMIWFPVIHNLKLERYDVFIVDEAQDLNRVQQEIALKSITKHGRLMLVGDRFQSIYGFRGADILSIPRMIDTLKATKLGVEVRPLTFTRRCPQTHVALAKHLVPDFNALPKAVKGTVSILQKHDALDTMQPNDMVLCRVNAPLIGIALRLISRGVRAQVQGRDIARTLKAFIKKSNADQVAQLVIWCQRYLEDETARLQASRKKKEVIAQLIENLEDKISCINILCDGLLYIEDVYKRIDSLFKDADGNVVGYVLCSSVHRAKGMEADRVFIVRPELMPHPKATDQQQEANIKYVALTRSKRDLYLVVEAHQASLTVDECLWGQLLDDEGEED